MPIRCASLAALGCVPPESSRWPPHSGFRRPSILPTRTWDPPPDTDPDARPQLPRNGPATNALRSAPQHANPRPYALPPCPDSPPAHPLPAPSMTPHVRATASYPSRAETFRSFREQHGSRPEVRNDMRYLAAGSFETLPPMSAARSVPDAARKTLGTGMPDQTPAGYRVAPDWPINSPDTPRHDRRAPYRSPRFPLRNPPKAPTNAPAPWYNVLLRGSGKPTRNVAMGRTVNPVPELRTAPNPGSVPEPSLELKKRLVAP